MTQEEKLQILESAMGLAYQRLSSMKAEDMGGETMSRLLDHLSNIGYLHERVMYPYKPLLAEDAPESDCPCHSCPKPDDPTKGDTETAAPTPAAEPEPEPTPESEESDAATMTFTEVRTILGDLSGRFPLLNLEALLLRFGANKLSAIDPSNYAALVQTAKELVREA